MVEIKKQPYGGVLRKRCSEICSKFTGEHPCQSVVSVKLQSNFIEMSLWHGYSPVIWLYIFRTPFAKNTSGRLLLEINYKSQIFSSYPHTSTHSFHTSLQTGQKNNNKKIKQNKNRIAKQNKGNTFSQKPCKFQFE